MVRQCSNYWAICSTDKKATVANRDRPAEGMVPVRALMSIAADDDVSCDVIAVMSPARPAAQPQVSNIGSKCVPCDGETGPQTRHASVCIWAAATLQLEYGHLT